MNWLIDYMASKSDVDLFAEAVMVCAIVVVVALALINVLS